MGALSRIRLLKGESSTSSSAYLRRCIGRCLGEAFCAVVRRQQVYTVRLLNECSYHDRTEAFGVITERVAFAHSWYCLRCCNVQQRDPSSHVFLDSGPCRLFVEVHLSCAIGYCGSKSPSDHVFFLPFSSLFQVTIERNQSRLLRCRHDLRQCPMDLQRAVSLRGQKHSKTPSGKSEMLRSTSTITDAIADTRFPRESS